MYMYRIILLIYTAYDIFKTFLSQQIIYKKKTTMLNQILEGNISYISQRSYQCVNYCVYLQ